MSGARAQSVRGWLAAIAIALPTGCLVCPSGAGAALTVVGGSARATVFLTEGADTGTGATKSKPTTFYTEGPLHLELRNTAAFPLRLRVLYSSTVTGTLDAPPGRSTLLSLVPGAPDRARLVMAAGSLTSRATAISRGTGGVPRDAAGAAALLLASSLSVEHVRPLHRDVHALAAIVFADVRGMSPALTSRASRAALELVAAVCPTNHRCPSLHATDVRPLLIALNRIASQGSAGLPALQSALVAVASTLRSHSYAYMGGHTVTQLNLRFRLPERLAPDALAGTLEIEGYTLRAARLAATVTVAVSGQIEPLGDVRFDPPTVKLQAVQWCLAVCDGSNSAIVHLYGTGVGRLLASLTPTSRIPGVVVRADRAAVVELTDLRRDPVRADAAMARIELTSTPDSGSYSGTLPLSRLPANSSALTVQIDSRKWVVWPVALVLLGVLASGWAFQRSPRARRRRLIRRALLRVIDGLLSEYRKLPVNLRETPLVRDVTRHVDISNEEAWTYYSTIAADDPASILAGARWARDDDDLREAENAAVAFIGAVTGWRKSLAQLGALWELVELEHDPEKQPGLRFTALSRDTRHLMSQVAAGSVAELEDAKLAAELERQTGWYRRFAEAWELRAQLESADGDVAAEAREVPLEALDLKARRFWAETRRKQEKHETSLHMLARRLEGLRQRSNQDPSSSDVDPVAIPPRPAEVRVEELSSPAPTTDGFADDPALALSITAASAGPALDPVPEWKEEPSEGSAVANPAPVLETTSADGVDPAPTSGTQGPLARAGAIARRLYRRADRSVRQSRLLFWLRFTDVLVSAAIVLLSSLVYTATLYNKDWGTVADCVAAFGAGFAGHVVVNWGLLPVYQSIRLRVRSGAGGASSPDAAPARGA